MSEISGLVLRLTSRGFNVLTMAPVLRRLMLRMRVDAISLLGEPDMIATHDRNSFERLVPHATPEAFSVVTSSREHYRFGSGPTAFVVHVPDFASWERIATASAYSVATAFVHGEFHIEGDLLAAIRWWHSHRAEGPAEWFMKFASRLRIESMFQTMGRARRNVAFHYDRSNVFYQQFLDSRMIYSCAYFADPKWSLDEAQLAKLDHICHKLDIAPGDRFLDVGCGWGALTIHAAECFEASSVGCTLSIEQLSFALQEVRARGLQSRVVVDGIDYRCVPGRFDKIASVGMYEHVGRRRLTSYFQTLANMLEPDGLLLNHGIARPQDTHDDTATLFLQRHVFPGGELPQLSDIIRSAERAGLEVLDVENLRPHYALTCAAWVTRLATHREACLAVIDAETYRTWVLYLAAAAVCFERGQTDLYQTLLAKRSPRAQRRITRDYMYAERNVQPSTTCDRTELSA